MKKHLVNQKQYHFLNPSKPAVQEKCFFPPETSFGSTSEKILSKNAIWPSEKSFFTQSLPTTKNFFRSFCWSVCLPNIIVHFFTLGKSEHVFFHSFRGFLHEVTCILDFPRMGGPDSLFGGFYVPGFQ